MKFKPKKPIKKLSLEEQAFVKNSIEFAKKWNKPYKGEIVYKNSKTPQEFVLHARYNNEEELADDAKSLIANMNKISPEKKWSIVSAKLLNKDIVEDNATDD